MSRLPDSFLNPPAPQYVHRKSVVKSINDAIERGREPFVLWRTLFSRYDQRCPPDKQLVCPPCCDDQNYSYSEGYGIKYKSSRFPEGKKPLDQIQKFGQMELLSDIAHELKGEG